MVATKPLIDIRALFASRLAERTPSAIAAASESTGTIVPAVPETTTLIARRLRKALEDENARLRAELWEQWEVNHSEHCNRIWPHPEGVECRWPVPEVLKKERDGRATR